MHYNFCLFYIIYYIELTNYEILFEGIRSHLYLDCYFCFLAYWRVNTIISAWRLFVSFYLLVASMSSGFLPCSSLCGIFIIGTSVSCNVAYLAFSFFSFWILGYNTWDLISGLGRADWARVSFIGKVLYLKWSLFFNLRIFKAQIECIH